MQCPKCGNILVRGQTICDVCGVTVERSTSEAVDTYDSGYISRVKPGKIATRVTNFDIKPTVQPDVHSSMSKSEQSLSFVQKNWGLLVGIIIAGGVLFVGCATFVLLKIFGII